MEVKFTYVKLINCIVKSMCYLFNLNVFMKKVHLKNLHTIWKKYIFQSLKWPCLYTSSCWHYLSQIEHKVKFVWYANTCDTIR
jgi:hypothetical protein